MGNILHLKRRQLGFQSGLNLRQNDSYFDLLTQQLHDFTRQWEIDIRDGLQNRRNIRGHEGSKMFNQKTNSFQHNILCESIFLIEDLNRLLIDRFEDRQEKLLVEFGLNRDQINRLCFNRRRKL